MIVEFFEHRLKPLAKAVYQPLVVDVGRVLRRLHRRVTYVGITGSAGKTTTKDLLHAALSAGGPTIANSNSNNQGYAIARTLMRLRPTTRFAVQELGASEPGALKKLLAQLRPDVGLVLNVGLDHRKTFRDADGIALEKRELVAALPADGLAVLNADDPRVAAMQDATRARVVCFAFGAEAEVQGRIVKSAWPQTLTIDVTAGGLTQRMTTQLQGSQQATCVLAAVATAWALGVPLPDIAMRIAQVQPMRGRMSLDRLPGDISFLRDDWKAPLWSLPAALEILRDARATRRLVVMGTLSDYAGSSRRAFRSALRAAAQVADEIILVGDRADRATTLAADIAPTRMFGFATVKAAAAHLAADLRAGDLVLLKGSNQADHLARIPLSLQREVGCWLTRCGRQEFCDDCRLIVLRRDP
jgi:UDP-N-acetylmuramoyl-tripeptide--D-alanyl-D-alanine ligase